MEWRLNLMFLLGNCSCGITSPLLLILPQLSQKKSCSQKRRVFWWISKQIKHSLQFFLWIPFLGCRSKGFALWRICLFRLLSLPRGIQFASGNIPDIDFFLTQIVLLFIQLLVSYAYIFKFLGPSFARCPYGDVFFADCVTCANFSNLWGKFLKTQNRYRHHVFAKSWAGSNTWFRKLYNIVS